MARIVMKFGGTSMAGIERIRHVAALVKREAERGNQVAVVVSAMAGETDRLVQLCREAASLYDPREYDVVVASGEQVTSGLLAITLQGMGLNARSYMGWQLPIRASGHAAGLIEGIDVDVLERVFDEDGIAIIPGFQGVAADGAIATLGRGGSDTSAVALAAAMKADRCDIYTDVDGVYTTDPRIVPRARKLDIVTYDEMLELASVGAKVLQTRSVGLAVRYKLPLQVLSSFEDKPGTMIVGDDAIEDSKMERNVVTGIAFDKNEAMVTLFGLPDVSGTVAKIFEPLAEQNINVDMIVQSSPIEGEKSALTFTIPKESLDRSLDALNKRKAEIGFDEIIHYTDVVKVSVVGVGMRSQSRRRREDVRDPGRAADQHPRHLDLGDQSLGDRRHGLCRARRPRPPHRLRARRGGRERERREVDLRATTELIDDRSRLMARGTDFLGCDYAVLGGAMSWISERNLVSALSNAGAFGVIACGAMTPDLLDTEIAETKKRTQQAVRRQPDHHAPDALRADRRLRAARGQPCRPRRRAAAGRRDRPDQGQWREADLLRPGAGAGQEADPLGRRRAGHRGDGGGRPYRPGLDLGARPGNPAAARRRGADLRRRRHRPWRADRRLSRNGRGGRPARHPLRLRAPNASPIPISRRPSSAPRRATRSPACRSTRACRSSRSARSRIARWRASPPSSARSPSCSTRARSR